jgi:hypothetical protein
MGRSGALLLSLVALGACVPATAATQPARAPVQPPIVRPAPAAAPAPARSIANWADLRLTPGRWVYAGGQVPSAQYGSPVGPLLTVKCAARGQIVIQRHGGAGATALTIRTSSTVRTIPSVARPDGSVATLPAGDPLLDAIAFSRGRFAVEAAGTQQLIIPAWPEPARVVEDCRR